MAQLSLNNKQIDRLAAFLKTNCKPDSINLMILPIREIDGILVEVVFTCEGTQTNVHNMRYLACTISLAPNIGYTMAGFSVRDFDADFTLECGLILLLNKLSTLGFNKMLGLIETTTGSDNVSSLERNDVILELCNILNSFKNITLTVCDCCVCFELTKTFTSCKHQLCIACYSKLPVEKEGWCEFSGKTTYMKSCPVCRGIITKMLPDIELGELSIRLIPETI